jgi:O-antigen chain-terminating methyltransferase
LSKLQSEEQHLLDALYVAFEDRFRGNREDIKERVRVYLPYIEKSHSSEREARVLDIGCGRGEWLELLRENGYSAQGIDTNRIMVDQCRERGLNVEEYEAIRFLRDQAPGTFSAVTGLHIVEHLPLPVLIQLLDGVFRILRPGGIAIFETPNPENMIVGATFFHIDPTHGNPVHPLTMDFLLGQRGFSRTEILRMHAMPSQKMDNKVVHDLLFGPQDFAAIGYKQ